MTLFGYGRSMILALGAGCMATPGLAEDATPSQTQGTVVLYQFEHNFSCSIPVPYEQQGVRWTYTLRYTQGSACTFDKLHEVGLLNVPSQVTVRLFKEDWCDKKDRDGKEQPWLELRTTKQPTTTSQPFDLTHVFEVDDDQFVRPNVRVVAKGPQPTADNMLDGNVNCVQIENSAR